MRGIVEADTVSVRLLDEDAGELVARATCGIEEEVQQRVRVPVGLGFGGRIAKTKRPVVLDRVDAKKVVNPISWEKGVRRMLGVPLLDGGRWVISLTLALMEAMARSDGHFWR